MSIIEPDPHLPKDLSRIKSPLNNLKNGRGEENKK